MTVILLCVIQFFLVATTTVIEAMQVETHPLMDDSVYAKTYGTGNSASVSYFTCLDESKKRTFIKTVCKGLKSQCSFQCSSEELQQFLKKQKQQDDKAVSISILWKQFSKIYDDVQTYSKDKEPIVIFGQEQYVCFSLRLLAYDLEAGQHTRHEKESCCCIN
jgi:hypothetical protein